MTDITLLPCPFCGGKAKIVEGEESAYVQCVEMKMHRALWFDGDNTAANEVVEQWNRRAIPSQRPAVDVVEGDGDYFDRLVLRAKLTAAKASVKFPQPNYVTLKIAEEAGEVVRGAVHYAENRMEWSEVEGEIVQLLAMLIRFVTEGDQINGVKPPALASLAPQVAPANPAQVTDAMVEAGAKALYREAGYTAWRILGDMYKNAYRDRAKVVLTAAIGAGGQAVEEFVYNGEGYTPTGRTAALSQPHPADERVVEVLRETADAIETLLSAEPDMPTYQADYDAAERQLERARAFLSAKEGR